MMHKYQENEQVVLIENFIESLPAGSTGAVFCQYTTTPPAYEVNFVDTEGQVVGGSFYEDEIEAARKVQPQPREAAGAG